jgi:hypothetical protein
MELERRENSGVAFHRLFYLLPVITDGLLSIGLDFRRQLKTRSKLESGETQGYLPRSNLKYPSFGIAIACGLVQSFVIGWLTTCVFLERTLLAKLV